jgi:hypothetical protein
MASNWDFSRKDTPSPNLDEISHRFFEIWQEQRGGGVVTRRQAQLQALTDKDQKPSASATDSAKTATKFDDNDSFGHASNGSESVSIHSNPPSPRDSLASVKSLSKESDDDPPYLQETLVAENSDLKAYIIKTHFKRMKNFV